jgi:DNA-binding NarL/FixJ family response regulator
MESRSGAGGPDEAATPDDSADFGRLRPLERAVLHRLAEGMPYDDLARRLHREASFVEFVESMALYKLEHGTG